MKKGLLFIFIAISAIILIGCKSKPIDPTSPSVTQLTPLELAIQNTSALENYTLNIDFVSNDLSYLAVIKMSNNIASVDALDELIYYEVSNDTCYIYEQIHNEWSKSEISCSEKGTQELSFLINFSPDYFVKNIIDSQDVYLLKFEHYTSLGNFFGGSTAISNFRMLLENDFIHLIMFTLNKDEITFHITIEITQKNLTNINLPNMG